MYGIELTEEDYEELALVCFETIGNKRTRVYKYIGNIDCNNTLSLPCNCYEDDSKIPALLQYIASKKIK